MKSFDYTTKLTETGYAIKSLKSQHFVTGIFRTDVPIAGQTSALRMEMEVVFRYKKDAITFNKLAHGKVVKVSLTEERGGKIV